MQVTCGYMVYRAKLSTVNSVKRAQFACKKWSSVGPRVRRFAGFSNLHRKPAKAHLNQVNVQPERQTDQIESNANVIHMAKLVGGCVQ